MIENNINPLVTCIVIVYNSSKYVFETLESIKEQTYRNIELIVSDDCSVDDTVAICKKWMDENKDRFVRTELITVEKNTGIPSNCNRALIASKGEFLKFIAGDDVILPEFIEKCLSVFKNDNKIAVTYTNSKIIDENSNFVQDLSSKKYKSGYIFKEMFFVEFWPAAPSFMYKRESVIEIGGFDESIGVEDYLLILKLAQKYKIQHVNDYLTKYRQHKSNISKNKIFLFESHLATINKFREFYGYRKRIKQLKSNLIYSFSKTDKKEAVKLIAKNLNSIYWNSIWLKILFHLLNPRKLLK